MIAVNLDVCQLQYTPLSVSSFNYDVFIKSRHYIKMDPEAYLSDWSKCYPFTKQYDAAQ